MLGKIGDFLRKLTIPEIKSNRTLRKIDFTRINKGDHAFNQWYQRVHEFATA
jgi:hypothetical protein